MRVEFNYSWPTTPYNYFSVFPVRKCRVVSFAIEHIRNITASLHDRDICIGILRYFDSIRYRVFVYAIYFFSIIANQISACVFNSGLPIFLKRTRVFNECSEGSRQNAQLISFPLSVSFLSIPAHVRNEEGEREREREYVYARVSSGPSSKW